MKKGLVLLMLVGVLSASIFGCGKKDDVKENKATEESVDKEAKDDKKEDKKADKEDKKKDDKQGEEDDLSKYDLSAGVVTVSDDLDANGIANMLRTNIDYKDELMEVSLDKAAMFYDFSGIKIDEGCLYESSGATAEEIVVLKCSDSQSVAVAKEVLSGRVSEQIESFKDYVPEEITKLKSAVIISNSEYAILSVSDDPDGAKKIIEEALAQ